METAKGDFSFCTLFLLVTQKKKCESPIAAALRQKSAFDSFVKTKKGV
jgi:hypothetical protein